MSNWMNSDDIRMKVVVSSLQSRSHTLREAASQCRKAYTKDYMNIPMQWLADAFDEAAGTMEARLTALASIKVPT